MKTILIVGAAGAQGAAVVRALAATGDYHTLIFTRNATSAQAQALTSLPNVEVVINSASQGYDLVAFEQAARRSHGVFINTDGFSLGEIAETYWGIRLYETAVKAKVKHVMYSGLDDAYRSSNYESDFYVSHFQGKSRVQAFIQAQPKSETTWTITRTGPYIEMLSEGMIPRPDAKGKFVFTYPLDDGEVFFIHLDDYGRIVDWIFRYPDKSAGLDLGVAIAHISGQEIADAFTAVTGKPAVFNSVPAAAWCKIAFSRLPDGANTKVGFKSVQDPSALTLTYEENFTNFWNLFKASKGNIGLVKRDYKLLDEILPNRVRSVREWMERTNYTGEARSILKDR